MPVRNPFQSTFPHGERQDRLLFFLGQFNVSIHVPARGTTGSSPPAAFLTSGFNPRSRTGNDDCGEIGITYLSPVSIHVPARGTTRNGTDMGRAGAVSIHVPARGTTSTSTGSHIFGLFQSTFPHGERHYICYSCIAVKPVSIHVPARGTTAITRPCGTSEEFQSTFPHGERHVYLPCRAISRIVSIHVPARGTTVDSFFLGICDIVSIHVPARGTTFQCQRLRILPYAVSIHVPARGTTWTDKLRE